MSILSGRRSRACLYRLHPGAARSWHDHPAGLRGAFGAYPRLTRTARKADIPTRIGGAPSSPDFWCSAQNRSPRSASHGVGGDLLFATAGLFWATFGTLLRLLARVRHTRDRGGRRALDSVFTHRCLQFRRLRLASCGSGLIENLIQDVGTRRLAGSCRFICSRARSSCSAPAARHISWRWCRCSAGYRLFRVGVVPSSRNWPAC